MRSAIPLLISAVLAMAPLARAQTAAAPSTTAASAAASGAIVREPTAEHAKPRSLHKHRAKQARASGTAHASAQAGAPAGVSLGATDITGNKELPKVMVIVPWKDSLGAGGVIKPTDSLMDEVLQPVDRGVFQRRIRYYGQLDAAGQPAAANRVAPVGDRH